MRLVKLSFAVAVLLVAAACALKAPTLRVQRVSGARVGITGAQLDVVFAVRNPNPDDLLVERFDYELFLNGRRVGRGFMPDPIELRGFDQATVRSQADLSFIRVPGAIKEVLDHDRVKARAKGHFHVRERGGGSHRLGFDSEAEVDLR